MTLPNEMIEKKIQFKMKDLPKLMNQYVVIGKNGLVRLPKNKEKPTHALGMMGGTFALYDIKKQIIIL